MLAPAFWAIIFGMVSAASDAADAPAAAPYIAFGLAVIPFVFVALAFLSEHPRAPGAAVKGMIVSLLVGIPVSALAQDAVTGLVAGLGAGGIFALRMDLSHTVKARIIAVVAVTVYCFFLLRTVSGLALLIGPALPFTSLGIADHLSERRLERRRERVSYRCELASAQGVEERELALHGVRLHPGAIRALHGPPHVPGRERIFVEELDRQAGVDQRGDDLAQAVLPAVFLLGLHVGAHVGVGAFDI